jgi:hypothetical protein
MTEEEAWALDEEVIKNPPKVTGNGTGGVFARHKESTVIFIDHVSATWLRVQAEATHKTPAEIIGALIRKEIAAAMA